MNEITKDEQKSYMFRTLNAEEVECKATVNRNAIEVSLHCKASTCTRILNETVGPLGWEKSYTYGNKNCVVSIWDDKKNRFVSKEDCGGLLTEFDGYKGQASNGFKRVCALGWGIGLELYSQPKIRLPITEDNVAQERNQYKVLEDYSVTQIEFSKERKITRVVIQNQDGIVVYDGPDESGGSRVNYLEATKKEGNHPDDEDVDSLFAEIDAKYGMEDEQEHQQDEDIFSQEPSKEDFTEEKRETSPTPSEIIKAEVERTGVDMDAVLSVLGISNIEDADHANPQVLQVVIRRLNKRPSVTTE